MRRALYLIPVLGLAAGLLAAPSSAGAQTLSFDYFKANVQPIFLKKRPEHTRCIVCHAGANNAMRLTPLERGATNFTEEQSRTNFQTLSQIVVPGKPMESLFLTHPLQPEFGGSAYHS